MEQISHLLTAPSTRLLTLTGAGGIGKTRLALQTALNLQNDFKDGVWLVELAPVLEPGRLPGRIAQTLFIREEPGQPLLSIIISSLQQKQLLLVLDNCEHLIDECARVTETLLTACPGLSVLATSREGLAINGETILRVPSLSLHTGSSFIFGAALKTDLNKSEAVRLFLERVQAAQPDFVLNDENVQPIVQICARLDGIPLALELAAARTKTLTVEQLAARLDDSFRLLTGGSRTALPRQRTLRALLDWSYNLLTEPEKVVLRRLSVFTGSFSLEAAEAICTGEFSTSSCRERIESDEVAGLLGQLVNKSLVVTQDVLPPSENRRLKGERRFRLLEPIRQYSQQNLEGAGEIARFHGQHRDWYLQLAEEAEKNLNGPEQYKRMFRLEMEQTNLTAALAWSLQNRELEQAVRLATGLWNLWYTHLQFDEVQVLDQLVAENERTYLPPELQARLFNTLGKACHSLRNNFEKAIIFHQKALGTWQEIGDKSGVTRAWLDIGWCYFMQLKLEETLRSADNCLVASQVSGDKWFTAAALHLKAIAFSMSGHPEQATPLAEQALILWRELGDRGSLVSTLSVLAQSQVKQGKYEQVKPLVAEAFTLELETGNALGISVSLNVITDIAAHSRKQPEGAIRASRLMGLTQSGFENVSNAPPPMVRAILANIKKKIISILDEETFAHETGIGKKLTRSELIKLVEETTRPEPEATETASVPANPQKARAATAYPAGLTGREVEILRLVAAGLSNPQIAQKLVLSRRTVEAHLHTIFSKIEVTSRVEATRFALENGLAFI